MKKFLLFALMLSFGLSLWAQNKTPGISSQLAKQSITAKRIKPNDRQPTITNQVLPLKASPLTLSNNQIGTTEFDAQSYACVQNRLVKHADGTFSAAWTMGTASFADRGTGYNYFDGSAWQAFPIARIETSKSGWPSMTVASGNEVVVSHSSNVGLIMTTRTKGTGSWTSVGIPFSLTTDQAWPRAMGKGLGSGTLHVVASRYLSSASGEMLYSRSLDGGATWDKQNVILPGADPVTEMLPTGADSYYMDVKGDTVGIVLGDMTTDVVLIKSFDGGTTWNKQTIWQHQVPLWNTSLVGGAGMSDGDGDGMPDTLTVTDGRYALIIDNDGVFHVFMGITKVKRDSVAAADNFSYWPYTDGLVYWNSTQPTIVPISDFYADTLLNKVGYMVDVNGDDSISFNTVSAGLYPWGEYAFTSLSSMPSAAIGTDGAVYCTFSSLVEGTDMGDGRGYRNIYAIKSTDHGTSWTEPVNITRGDYAECTFGSLNRTVDSDLYMVYQESDDPGIYVVPTSDNPHPQMLTRINFIKISNDLVNDLSVNEVSKNNISVSQNYPNPFNGTTLIDITLANPTAVDIEIVNLLGQRIGSSIRQLSTGTHTVALNTENLKTGIYFYTVKTGSASVSRKMIVE